MPKPQRRRVSPGSKLTPGQVAQHQINQAAERHRRGLTGFTRSSRTTELSKVVRAESNAKKSKAFSKQVGESRLSEGVRSRQTRNQITGFGRGSRS